MSNSSDYRDGQLQPDSWRKNRIWKRMILARFVAIAYILGKDANLKKDDMSVSFCGYELIGKLESPYCKKSIFGAVFKRIRKDKGAPEVIIAFRGTDPRPPNGIPDLFTDMKVLTNRLDSTAAFQECFECLKYFIDKYGGDNVIVAGHSLGSFLLLVALRKLAKDKTSIDDVRKLEAHLFNPPFPSLKHTKLKEFKGKIVKRFADDDVLKEIYQDYFALSDWIPYLYVNPHDIICKGYIRHFRNVEEKGRAVIDAVLCSARAALSERLKMNSRPWHIIPSAILVISNYKVPGFCCSAHSLRQWLTHDPSTNCRRYVLPPCVRPSSAARKFIESAAQKNSTVLVIDTYSLKSSHGGREKNL